MLTKEPDAEVRYAVELYALCKEFHVLPRPGGLLDQDYYEVQLLSRVAEAFEEKQKLEADRQKAQMPKRPHM